MAQPFDTHSYPVVPSTEGITTGDQFGSTSEQSDSSSQPQFSSTSQHTSGLPGQSGSGFSSTGSQSNTTGSSAQQALNNPGQTAANVTNKVIDCKSARLTSHRSSYFIRLQT